jgi:hypothetical protein
MAIEFLHGQPPEDLELIRQQIESGFDDITEIDPEFAALWSGIAAFAGQASARPMMRIERIGAFALACGALIVLVLIVQKMQYTAVLTSE